MLLECLQIITRHVTNANGYPFIIPPLIFLFVFIQMKWIFSNIDIWNTSRIYIGFSKVTMRHLKSGKSGKINGGIMKG